MYRQIVHFLQGQVLVRIECGCPERVLNLCGARGIPFWELTWESPVCLTLRAVGRDLPRLRQAAEDAEAARQQALREGQADCDALRQRAGAKMPQAVDTILRRVVQE